MGPIGDLRAAAASVPALGGIYGLLRLRCQPYGGSIGLWAAEGMAMGLDLCVSMGLQCGTYGVRKSLWDCGVGLMGTTSLWSRWLCVLRVRFLWPRVLDICG